MSESAQDTSADLDALVATGLAGLVPRPFRVDRSRRETADTVTLTLAPVTGGSLEFAAGQFTMLGVPGVGEVPISISGDPTWPDALQHTVRDVGGVSHAIASARAGDVLTVRGPFGTGWGVGDGEGGDVLIVAGGIGLAPLRPALLELLAHRHRYRTVTLLYGARTPQDILFAEELAGWRGRFDLEVELSVDYAPPSWRGRVGLVTALIASVAPEQTLALVCGPEVMMRFVTTELLHRGVPAEQIRLSLERAMSCGVGLCGHCQLRELFVCLDGPVFRADRVLGLMTVEEL